MQHQIDRAERATRLARVVEYLAIFALTFLGMYGVAYLTTVGEDLRQARIATEQCEQWGVCRD